jgi:predicted O-methyltransferase YrrM
MPSEDIWAKVDTYIEQKLIDRDAALEAALEANRDAGLPPIDVSPAQGRLLELLVRISGARRILEIGTLGGYSTICMARGLPDDGQLTSLEYSPRHAEVARANIDRAGLSGRVTIRVGAAADALPLLAAEIPAPFDFVFIDADKPGNPVYLDWAVKLGRPGTVIVVDNVVRDGRVIEAGASDGGVTGSRAAFDVIGTHPRLRGTALQTVGTKGYDGFALAVVG